MTESLSLASYAHDAGASALVLAPPCYFVPDQAELASYIQGVATRVELPLYLYNMPSHTKVAIGIETIRRAMDLPNVAGVKDSSGDMTYFHAVRRVLRSRPELSLLVGPEELLAEAMMLGGDGGVAGGSNLNPTLFVELYNAASKADWVRVAEIHDRIVEINTTLYGLGQYGGNFLKSLKCALACVGLCSDRLAEPLAALPAKDRQRIAQQIEAPGLGPRALR
jgi:4-hydroxy-tetrahydrodipicolinate synthase